MHRKSLEAAETLKISDDNNSDKEEETRTETSDTSLRTHSQNLNRLGSPPDKPMSSGQTNNNMSHLNNNHNSKSVSSLSIKSSISPVGSSMISPQSLSSSSSPPLPAGGFLASQRHTMSPTVLNSKKPIPLKDEYYNGTNQQNHNTYYPEADSESFRCVDYQLPSVFYTR
jgi:hypothetical protein